MVVNSKYGRLLETSKRSKLVSWYILELIGCNKRFIWSKTNYRYYQWSLQYMLVLKQFLSNLVIKIPLLLHILLYLSISGYYLGSGFETWDINLINHEIPRISLFTIFRRWEVSHDRYLVDCYTSIFVASMNGEWILLRDLRLPSSSVGLNHAHPFRRVKY